MSHQDGVENLSFWHFEVIGGGGWQVSTGSQIRALIQSCRVENTTLGHFIHLKHWVNVYSYVHLYTFLCLHFAHPSFSMHVVNDLDGLNSPLSFPVLTCTCPTKPILDPLTPWPYHCFVWPNSFFCFFFVCDRWAKEWRQTQCKVGNCCKGRSLALSQCSFSCHHQTRETCYREVQLISDAKERYKICLHTGYVYWIQTCDEIEEKVPDDYNRGQKQLEAHFFSLKWLAKNEELKIKYDWHGTVRHWSYCISYMGLQLQMPTL